MMTTFVAAGYGIGFAPEGLLSLGCRPGVIVRPITDEAAQITTYFLRRKENPSEQLSRFSRRVKLLDDHKAL